MAQVFEMIMLICFGLSWPFNITKSVRSRTAKGNNVKRNPDDEKPLHQPR